MKVTAVIATTTSNSKSPYIQIIIRLLLHMHISFTTLLLIILRYAPLRLPLQHGYGAYCCGSFCELLTLYLQPQQRFDCRALAIKWSSVDSNHGARCTSIILIHNRCIFIAIHGNHQANSINPGFICNHDKNKKYRQNRIQKNHSVCYSPIILSRTAFARLFSFT